MISDYLNEDSGIRYKITFIGEDRIRELALDYFKREPTPEEIDQFRQMINEMR